MAKRQAAPDPGPDPFAIPATGGGGATATAAPPPPPAAASAAAASEADGEEGDEEDGGNGAAPKKAQASALERVSRILGKRIKELEGLTDVDKAVRDLALDGLRGLKALVDTREQLGDPSNPPAPDSAWGRAIAFGKAKARAASIL